MSGDKDITEMQLEEVTSLSFEDGFNVAIAMHKASMLQQARDIYLRLLEAAPDFPDVLNLLGVVSHQLGDSDRGLELLSRCVEKYPDYADAQNNLGNVLKERSDDEAARAAYERVLELVPDHANALNNLGVISKNRGDCDAAIGYLRRTLEIEPKHAEAWHNLANVFERVGRLDDAVAAARNAVKHGPSPMAMHNLASALRKSDQMEEALRVIRRCLILHPDDPVAAHQLAAYSGENIPERASDNYVRHLFDAFAGSFDTVLEGLDYRVPELIRRALGPAAGATLRVLDAGCGTGLCGPFLRPFAQTLVGVDLSAKMLARARQQNCYDELVEAELSNYLQQHPGGFDLIVSGDTLCYFGDLSGVMRMLADALSGGGRALLTLETLTDESLAFRLNPTGRYSHSRPQLERDLAAAGLNTLSIDDVVLRMETGEPVNGFLVTVEQP